MSRSRCPACGAAVRDGAPWCLLCHCDLTVSLSAASTGAAPSTRARDAAEPPTRARHAAEPSAEARWPCTGCGADNALDAAACATCGAGFLAGLHGVDSPSLTLPVIGEVWRLSRNARLALAVGLGLVVALLLTGLVLLIGTLL